MTVYFSLENIKDIVTEEKVLKIENHRKFLKKEIVTKSNWSFIWCIHTTPTSKWQEEKCHNNGWLRISLSLSLLHTHTSCTHALFLCQMSSKVKKKIWRKHTLSLSLSLWEQFSPLFPIKSRWLKPNRLVVIKEVTIIVETNQGTLAHARTRARTHTHTHARIDRKKFYRKK